MRLFFLKIILGGLSIAAIFIGVLMFTLGPQATGDIFAHLFSSIIDMPKSVPGLDHVNVDSELRFYSVLWITYGAIAFQTARALPNHLTRARILMLIFFMGGVARLFSIAQFGMPHPLFNILMSVELVLPVVWIGLSLVKKTL